MPIFFIHHKLEISTGDLFYFRPSLIHWSWSNVDVISRHFRIFWS